MRAPSTQIMETGGVAAAPRPDAARSSLWSPPPARPAMITDRRPCQPRRPAGGWPERLANDAGGFGPPRAVPARDGRPKAGPSEWQMDCGAPAPPRVVIGGSSPLGQNRQHQDQQD